MIQFGEKLELDKVLQLLSHALPYYQQSWHDVDEESGLFGTTEPHAFNMRKVGTSSPVIEYVVRPHLHILCILASYIRLNALSRADSPISSEEASNYLNRGIRWICSTHLTGTRDVDSFLARKRWGENWRSGLWATLLGVAGYMASEVVEKELLNRIQGILAYEANRFIDVTPPSGCEMDTKLEENAQDAMTLAWAINMIPDHPNRPDWDRALAVWAVNIASSFDDRSDHSEYLGKSISHWVTTQTLFPDMTAENHGFFHPEILSYGSWVVMAMSAFELHGNEIPAYLRRKNHQKTFDVLLRFCLPSGMIFIPGGHDLPMFSPRPLALAWGLWNNDPRARRMTAKLLAWMDEHLLTANNSSVPWVLGFDGHKEGWELLFQSQIGFELAMLAVLPFPQEHRFYSSGQIESAVDTRRIYPYVEVCYRRNTRTTRSVAWKAIGKHPVITLAIHQYPELVASFRASFLGIPRTQPATKEWEVAHHEDSFQKDGFDTSGLIRYGSSENKNLIRREIRCITWGDDGLLVFDRIQALENIYFEEQYLSPVYLVNDHWTGSEIHLSSGSLHETIAARHTAGRVLSCPSFWASIENQLLMQLIWGRSKGLVYMPGNERNAPRFWKNCRFDMLAVHVEGGEYMKDDTIYQIGFYIGAGKGPRPFKSAGSAGEFFKGLVVMDGKSTIGLA